MPAIRLIQRLIATALLLLVAFPLHAATRLQTILARHAAAVGGLERVRSLRTLTWRGICQDRDGALSGLTWQFQVPGFAREEVRNSNIFTTVEVRAPYGAWSADPTGEIRDEAPSMDNLVIRQVLDQYRYLDSRERDVSVSLSRDSADSARYVNLRVEALGAEPVVLALDSTTWRVAKRIWRGANSVEEEYLSDYRSVEGLQLPFRFTDFTNRRAVLQTRLLQAELRDSLPAATWRRPSRPIRDWTMPAGRRSSTVPIDVRGGRIHVTGRVNGTALDFVLDTGSANTLVSADAARRLRLPVDSADVHGDSAAAIPSVADSMELGSVVVRGPARIPVGVLPGQSGGGVLGTDFLARFVVTIDYATRTLTLEDPIGWVPEGGLEIAPLNFNFGVPLVRATVDSCCPGNFLVSTAAEDSIHLRYEFVRSYKYDERMKSPDTDEDDERADLRAAGRARTFEFAGQRLESPAITYARAEGPGEADTGGWIAGTLGAPLLQHYRLILDYPRRRMMVEPLTGAPTKP